MHSIFCPVYMTTGDKSGKFCPVCVCSRLKAHCPPPPPPPPPETLVKEIKEITNGNLTNCLKKEYPISFPLLIGGFPVLRYQQMSNGQKIRGKQQHKLPPILCTVTSLILQLLSPSYLVMHNPSYVCISAVSVLHNMSLSVH